MGPGLASAADNVPIVTLFDELLEAKSRAGQMPLAEPCDDATFLRRVWIDLAGHVPPVIPAREFLADPDSQKRVHLVDELLGSDDFAEHWGRVLTEVFTDRRPVRQGSHDGQVLSRWLAQSLREGRSYQQVVHDLVAGDGTTESSGAANFLFRYEVAPEQLAGAVGQRFLGVSLQCAQCHNHPFQKWQQGDFWGVAAFFARTKRLDGENGSGDYLRAVADVRRGELQIDDPDAQPEEDGSKPQKTVAPRFIDGSAPATDASRRAALADWVTAAANPYFAQNGANRVWAQLFGRGLVHPLDELGGDAPGPQADVLLELSREYTESGFNLRQLLRTIVLSRTYSRQPVTAAPSSDPAEARQQVASYAVFPVRPLTTDEVYASVVQATGYTGVDEEGRQQEIANDPNAENAYAYRDWSTELMSERALTVQRSLVLLNSEFVHEAVRQGARNAVAAHGTRPGERHVEHLFVATLSRKPTADESAEMQELLAQADWEQQGLEDVLWVLLNSAEFNVQR
jgi:hypothetical protein